MTRELNKEGLEAAAAEILMDLAFLQPKVPIVIAEKAIQTYLSHPKATGFEGRIEKVVNDLHDNGFDDVIVLLEDMQAALAGGGHE